jgi:amidohydrolase
MFSSVQKHVLEITPQMIEWRRFFHEYPELGFEEVKAAEKIGSLLREWGYEVTTGIGKTGVIGFLNNNSDFTLGLRFDMDALPITEATDLPFSSKHAGIMHACGHDGHMSVGLGVAYVLAQLKQSISGNIKVIFQPAEEGLGGALAMIEDGVLENPKVDVILGLHIWPELDSGTVGVRPGTIMAAADKFEITLYGSGGHGGQPHLAIDPITLSAEVIEGLQTIVSREVAPTEPVVISIGSVHGGTAFNIIPNQVELTGTIRTADEAVRERVLKRIEEKVQAIVKGNNASCDIHFKRCFYQTFNDDSLVEEFRSTVIDSWGAETLVDLKAPTMTGEDFSEYQRVIPGLYVFVGTRSEAKGLTFPIHHEKYSIDEDVLDFGVEVMVKATLNLLKKGGR